MGLSPAAFANPPYGTTYRVYTGHPSSQTFDTRDMPRDVKGSKAFFAKVVDEKNRIWVAYHMLFKRTKEWRLFWFFAPVHLVTSGNQMGNLRECHAYKP